MNAFIPGDGYLSADALHIIRDTAYHSVELALSLGINTSLFTIPVGHHLPGFFDRDMRESFTSGAALGGIMITEPSCGTDVLSIRTSVKTVSGCMHIRGEKHWAGLTGLADYWLVLARDFTQEARLPSLNLFICRAEPGQVDVREIYKTIGLRAIPYGRTAFDARSAILTPLFSGSASDRLRALHSVLQRSRASISAITLGAVTRLRDIAQEHVGSRTVFGKTLDTYGQVQARMSEIEGHRAMCEALFDIARREVARVDAGETTEVEGRIANIVKVLCTDASNSAAQCAAQLQGGNHFRSDTFTGRAVVDLRPFRIFEGSNDVLYEAIYVAEWKRCKSSRIDFMEWLRAEAAALGVTRVDVALLKANHDVGGQSWKAVLGRVVALLYALAEVNRLHPDLTARLPGYYRLERDLRDLQDHPHAATLSEM
ncbi:MAG: acyl-CoA dehydrogenase [Lentisphaerae bacterium]|nr:acyl-CoA dehydrogenase [Lentisphaerota bacterium]